MGETQKPKAIAYVENQKQHQQPQSLNAWLERTAEFDEGPDDTGLIVGPVPDVVREGRPLYYDLGEPPF